MNEQPYKKKLIEVALPLEAINAACKKDTDRKTGTIRNLHKWFAPMPVPALRALIFASLVDDPGDDAERSRMMRMIENIVASVVEDPPADLLAQARAEVRRGAGEELPIVLDPFCGAGSTLVEAQRLGLVAHGSDLNPIPVLITKTLTEFPPQVWNRPPLSAPTRLESSGLEGFFEDVRHYAARVYEAARERLGELYPLGPNGDPIIAWWWARTVPSPDPRYHDCPVPLVNGWWLSKKSGSLAYVVPLIDDSGRAVRFELRHEGLPEKHDRMRCLLSGAPISFDYVKEQGGKGALGEQLIALVTQGAHGRNHFIARDEDVRIASMARPMDGVDIPLPENALGFTVQLYGLRHWKELFAPRQQVALETFSDLVAQVPDWVRADHGDEAYSRAITAQLGLCVGKLAQHQSTLVRWFIDSRNGSGKATPAFSQQVISMTWDYIETNPFGESVGDWMRIVETSLSALKYVNPTGPPASVDQSDARQFPQEFAGKCLVVTDPPYFSAIGYANLADYFYPWLRRALKGAYPELFATLAGPKDGELIAEPARHGSKDDAKAYFIEGFTQVFQQLRNASRPDLPTLIVYAFKEQEAESGSGVSAGWEAILEAAIRADLTIVGTWPIHGTRSTRMRGVGSNALATYVVLVCRTRPATAVKCTRREFVSALKTELGESVRLLQSAAVAPVDLAQAVIGPAMSIFTRHAAVLEATGEPMTVRAALLMINTVLDEILAEQEGDYDPETRWAVTWFSQHAFTEAPSGEADALARAKVTSIDGLGRAGITSSRGGTTRLLGRDELPNKYDPRSDARPTVWEAVQHLVRALETDGELGAAELISLLADPNAARELTYRLYSVCERKGWALEGQAYNALAISWLEILERAEAQSGPPAQQSLEV